MNETNGLPHKEWTPEQLKAYLAEMQKKFTIEDLLEYINAPEDEVLIPAEQVLAEMDEIIRTREAKERASNK